MHCGSLVWLAAVLVLFVVAPGAVAAEGVAGSLAAAEAVAGGAPSAGGLSELVSLGGAKDPALAVRGPGRRGYR